MQDIIIASDHRGFALKTQIKDFLREKKFFFIDVGVESDARPSDAEHTPPIIKAVKEAVECVVGAKNFCGVLICSDGVAMSIAANRFKGIRAGICRTVDGVKQARQHNDINMLCLGADGLDIDDAKKIITAFMNTKPLDVPRYKRRQELFDQIS